MSHESRQSCQESTFSCAYYFLHSNWLKPYHIQSQTFVKLKIVGARVGISSKLLGIYLWCTGMRLLFFAWNLLSAYHIQSQFFVELKIVGARVGISSKLLGIYLWCTGMRLLFFTFKLIICLPWSVTNFRKIKNNLRVCGNLVKVDMNIFKVYGNARIIFYIQIDYMLTMISHTFS